MNEMYELAFPDKNHVGEKGTPTEPEIRKVTVLQYGSKYLVVEGGRRTRYFAEKYPGFKPPLNNLVAHQAVQEGWCNATTILFETETMAQLYATYAGLVKKARRVIEKKGLDALPFTVLEMIVKCGETEAADCPVYLKDLIIKNGHKLVRYDRTKKGHKYESVFSYSNRHGGTVDSFRFYNDWVVDVTPNQQT